MKTSASRLPSLRHQPLPFIFPSCPNCYRIHPPGSSLPVLKRQNHVYRDAWRSIDSLAGPAIIHAEHFNPSIALSSFIRLPSSSHTLWPRFLEAQALPGLRGTFACPRNDSVMSHPQLVAFGESRGTLDLVGAPILLDEPEERAVHIAASCFATDLGSVTGKKPAVLTSGPYPALDRAIIVGTVASALVKSLQLGPRLDLVNLAGRWEAFATAVVERPLPDCGTALVIVGSDKRGAAYGLYTISEQIGVSPYCGRIPTQEW